MARSRITTLDVESLSVLLLFVRCDFVGSESPLLSNGLVDVASFIFRSYLVSAWEGDTYAWHGGWSPQGLPDDGVWMESEDPGHAAS